MADTPQTPRPGPVLVVDDDPVLCEFIGMALGEQGYTVETAADGDAAVVAARRAIPALVIMDLGLPGPSGATLVARLQDECRAHVPCALMSGGFPGEDVLASPGVVGYLAKPFGVEALFELVGRYACASRPGVAP